MKIYNPKAPSSYNFYWSIQYDDPQVERMASRILLYYIQSNGKDNKERLEVFAEVAKKIGFTVEVVEKDGEWTFKIDDKEVASFDEMRRKIRNISRGNFESEVGQIYRILKEYAKKPTLLQRIKKLFSNTPK